MTDWRLRYGTDLSNVEENLYDVETVETANPFGDYAVMKIDDTGGMKFDNYPVGTQVQLRVDIDEVSSLEVDSAETHTVGTTGTQEYTTVRNAGTVQNAGTMQVSGGLTEFELGNGGTYSIGQNETETYSTARNAGTVTNAGTMQVADVYPHVEFTGFVVERREVEQNGADQLELEAYTFDQFLRRNTVSNSQRGNTIVEALEDIVTNDTPITWNASKVEVVDSQTLTVSLRGENVETALLRLAFLSGNEDFGVDSSLEFYFEPQESGPAPRSIDNTQWFNYDVPELGKETVNEVEVFYANGDKSVIVDDGANKKTLQNNLGLPSPATRKEEISRPTITELDDAKAEGERWLELKNTVLTGEVETYDLFTAEPGQVIPVTIEPRGIDTDFRIAAKHHIWSEDSTLVTLVENTEQSNNEVLVRLTEAVKRLETQDADRDGITNRITDSLVGVEIDTTGDVDGTSFSSAKITNELRNQIRDGWIGLGNVSVATIAVGNDSTQASRSDSSLGNQLESASASESLPVADQAQYSASFTTTDIREVGLFDSSGNLLARATIPDTSLSSPTVTITLTANTDTNMERAVLTNTGQTTVRDIIADNSPNLPNQYAYGSSTVDPAESDTSLGNQQIAVGLTELLVQSADANADWEDIVSISNSDPLEISNSEVSVLQSAFTVEGENPDADNQFRISDPSNLSDYSGGDAAYLSRGPEAQSGPDFVEYNFTLDYTIPSANFGMQYRFDDEGNDGVPAYEITLEHPDGTVITLDENPTVGVGIGSLGWRDITLWDGENYTGPDLEPGDYTVRFEVTDSNGTGDTYYLYLDVLAPYDSRYNYTFDDDNGGSSGFLDGPELYPDLVEVPFSEVETRRELDAATATQTWDNTGFNQKIELSNDGGSTWITTNNNSIATASFSSPSTQLQTRIGLSRAGARTSATPQTGFNGQAVGVHNLTANIQAITREDIGIANVRAIVGPEEITGTTIAEGGELDSNGNTLTHVSFAEFEKQSGERLVSSENVSFSNPD